MNSTVTSSDNLTKLPTQTVNLVEMFSAIQGEGLNVGTRQLFIRFGGCDLRCTYCDSAHTWRTKSQCRIEQTAGERDFQPYPNPVKIEKILAWALQLNRLGIHDSISLTGGEPLLAVDFLEKLLPPLQQTLSLPLYLETGGHHPQALVQIIPWLDSVGMDIKLPSVSGESHWLAHQAFLEVCYQGGLDIFCKVVISRQTDWNELHQAATLIRTVNPEIPLILQPITPIGTGRLSQPPTPSQVLAWQQNLKAILPHVRVIPQTHKMLNQL